MLAEDFSTFEDESALFKHFKLLGEGIGLLFHEGLFIGDVLHSWIAETLGQAQRPHLERPRPTRSSCRRSSNTSWSSSSQMSPAAASCACHGTTRTSSAWTRTHSSVADAVRASASIPFFFRPLHLRASRGSTRPARATCCAPTAGCCRTTRSTSSTASTIPAGPPSASNCPRKSRSARPTGHPNANPVDLARSLLSTMMNAHDSLHVDDPYYASRTVFVDTTGFSGTNFHLSNDDKAEAVRQRHYRRPEVPKELGLGHLARRQPGTGAPPGILGQTADGDGVTI